MAKEGIVPRKPLRIPLGGEQFCFAEPLGGPEQSLDAQSRETERELNGSACSGKTGVPCSAWEVRRQNMAQRQVWGGQRAEQDGEAPAAATGVGGAYRKARMQEGIVICSPPAHHPTSVLCRGLRGNGVPSKLGQCGGTGGRGDAE